MYHYLLTIVNKMFRIFFFFSLIFSFLRYITCNYQRYTLCNKTTFYELINSSLCKKLLHSYCIFKTFDNGSFSFLLLYETIKVILNIFTNLYLPKHNPRSLYKKNNYGIVLLPVYTPLRISL